MKTSERFSTTTGVLIGVSLYLYFIRDYQDIYIALSIPLSFLIGLIFAFKERKKENK